MLFLSLSSIWEPKKYSPTVKVNIEIGGFNEDVDDELQILLDKYLSQHHLGSLNVSLNFSLSHMRDEFFEKYVSETKRLLENSKTVDGVTYLDIGPNSPLVETIMDEHQRAVASGSAKYTLFIFYDRKPILFHYGDAHYSSQSIVLDTSAAFCHLDSLPRTTLGSIFDCVHRFVDDVLLPDLTPTGNSQPTSILIPITTFGLSISPSSISNKIRSLFPEIEVISVVNKRSIYDFPLVASSTDINSRAFALRSTENLLGSELYGQPNMTIYPVYLFKIEDEEDRIDIVDETSMIFSNGNHTEHLILTAVAQVVGRLPRLGKDFCGHHPMHPTGGADSFSSIFIDSIARNFAMSDIDYSMKQLDSARNKAQQIETINLAWMNSSSRYKEVEAVQNLLEQTVEFINENKLLQATAAASKAASLSDALVNHMSDELEEAQVFSSCCPVVIVKPIKRKTIGAVFVIVSVVLLLVWTCYKIIKIKKRNIPLLPKAFMF